MCSWPRRFRWQLLLDNHTRTERGPPPGCCNMRLPRLLIISLSIGVSSVEPVCQVSQPLTTITCSITPGICAQVLPILIRATLVQHARRRSMTSASVGASRVSTALSASSRYCSSTECRSNPVTWAALHTRWYGQNTCGGQTSCDRGHCPA